MNPRMDAVLSTIWSPLRDTAPMALFFILLAVIVKRAAILDALRRVRREATTNVLLFAINSMIVAPLVAIPFLTITGIVDGERWFAGFWAGVPGVVVLLVTILLIDLVAYWRHRLEHHPALWRYHATHHADTAIHWLSVHRKHPVGKALSMLVDLLLVLALGLPVWAIVLAGVIRTWWGTFIHADVPWTLGPLGKVLISPAAHRLHHIRDEALMGTNYGNTVTLWDRLFGTYVDPAPYIDCETGIEEGTRGILGELARPWEKRYRADATLAGEAEAA